MPIELNHTIVNSHDKRESAAFLARLLGLEVGADFGPFVPVAMSNGVTLDFMDSGRGPITAQHYAFLITEEEFDAVFARIQEGGVAYFADPGLQQKNEINRRDGGRGAYFTDPSGHVMEILTRPYGSGG